MFYIMESTFRYKAYCESSDWLPLCEHLDIVCCLKFVSLFKVGMNLFSSSLLSECLFSRIRSCVLEAFKNMSGVYVNVYFWE